MKTTGRSRKKALKAISPRVPALLAALCAQSNAMGVGKSAIRNLELAGRLVEGRHGVVRETRTACREGATKHGTETARGMMGREEKQ